MDNTKHLRAFKKFGPGYFIKEQMANGIKEYVVHCDAGVSRSLGVAVALEYCINNNSTIEPRNSMYNSLVYRRVVTACRGPII